MTGSTVRYYTATLAYGTRYGNTVRLSTPDYHPRRSRCIRSIRTTRSSRSSVHPCRRVSALPRGTRGVPQSAPCTRGQTCSRTCARGFEFPGRTRYHTPTSRTTRQDRTLKQDLNHSNRGLLNPQATRSPCFHKDSLLQF